MASRAKIISNSIASRIKSLRLQKNLTQKELAENLYKSESTVRMWELGKSEPDIETIIKIANFFNVSTEYLLGLDEHNNLTEQEQVLLSVTELLKNTDDDTTSDKKKQLISLAQSVPEDKVELLLKVMQSIVESD